MNMRKPLKALSYGLVLGAMCASSAGAADYFKGKTVTITVGSSAGGGYDGYARFLARHWGRLIPGNPNVIVKNMPGAGSLKATNFIYNIAAKDGTQVGAVQNGIIFEPLFKVMGSGDDAKFDATKLSWIGAVTKETAVMVVWHTTPFKSVADIRKGKVRTGSPGPTTSYGVYPRLMNATMGTNIQVIMGYGGTSDITLALERGEIEAMTGWDYSSLASRKGQWLKDKKVRVLVQFAKKRHPEMPDVPVASELTTSKLNRDVLELISARQEIGRPYIAPPGVPSEAITPLRTSFTAMMKDEAFLADANKSRIEVMPSDHKEALASVKEAFAASPEVVAKARSILFVQKEKSKKKKK
ncbi:MAG: Bug family tripartite tricarboxylate transporter substrate binding protein [Alphaproteobacteria bacterium]